jgi:sulfur-oxidizing protein SoxB
VDEGTQGPAIWELVERYVAARKTVRIPENRAIKVTGA